MDYQTTESSGNAVGLESSRSAVSQAEIDRAKADYCEAMCRYGYNSAEVLISRGYWMHLKRCSDAVWQRPVYTGKTVNPHTRGSRSRRVHPHD